MIDMIKTAINGINGNMGKVLTNSVMQTEGMDLVCGFDIYDEPNGICRIYKAYEDCKEDIDVIIDFSHPSMFKPLLEYAVKRKIPLVTATTGLSEDDLALMKERSKEIPIFHSANMSLGINLLIDLVKKAAGILYGNYDIEIIEKHHNQKIDAPSGTALMIADEITDAVNDNMVYKYDRHSQRKKREKNEIGIHAVRGGTIVGEHEVIFAGKDEILTVSHTAMSKEIFATGGIRAAKFIFDKKPGLYTMKELVGSKEGN